MIRVFLFILTGILLVFLVIFIWSSSLPEVPVEEIHKARLALSHAGKSEASKYDITNYGHANELWDSLLIEWNRQNKLFALKRNYSKLIQISEEVVYYAEKAAGYAEQNKSDLQITIEADKIVLQDILENFNLVYNKLPIDANIYNDFIKAGLLYAEGESAVERKEFLKAYSLIREGKLIAEKCNSAIFDTLSSYFNNFPKWKEWEKETITESTKNQTNAIIIDKFAQKCRIYTRGKLKHEFEAEFGVNWIGDKSHSGDKTTPEGKYFVTKKISPGKTKYYKALLISYPNEEDKKRYDLSIRNGIVPKDKGIGGLIEIHGGGGKGQNWTDGCIALKNEDMDRIYHIASPGTPVTIVGSLKPIKEIFNLDK